MKGKPVTFGILIGLAIFIVLIFLFWIVIVLNHGSFSNYSCSIKSYTERNLCYIELLAETDEVFLCDKVGYRNNLLDYCINQRQGQITEIKDCDNFDSREAKNYCEGIVAAKTDDIGICEGEPGDSASSKPECYNGYAYMKDDDSVCGGIDYYYAVERQRDECRIVVIAKNRDISACNNFQNRTYGDCVTAVAETSNNVGYCDLLEDDKARGYDYYHSDCIRDVAVFNSNSELCGDIPYAGYKTGCYGDIAKFTLNPELCQNIENEYNRDECKKIPGDVGPISIKYKKTSG